MDESTANKLAAQIPANLNIAVYIREYEPGKFAIHADHPDNYFVEYSTEDYHPTAMKLLKINP